MITQRIDANSDGPCTTIPYYRQAVMQTVQMGGCVQASLFSVGCVYGTLRAQLRDGQHKIEKRKRNTNEKAKLNQRTNQVYSRQSVSVFALFVCEYFGYEQLRAMARVGPYLDRPVLIYSF